MDNWRCEICGHLITMPCQRPSCVVSRKKRGNRLHEIRAEIYENLKVEVGRT